MVSSSLIVAMRKEAVSSPEGVKFLALEDIEGIIRAHQAEQPQNVVERVAQAICPLPVPWDKLNDDCKEIWRGYAKAAIAAMGEVTGKNHSTERVCPKVENREVPRGSTESANGDGCHVQQGNALPSPATDTLNGWHCPNCGPLQPVEVTFYENCAKCGAFVGDTDAPSEISVHPALANAAKILANFKGEPDCTKLEEWQAAYAMLFTQMNEICNQRESSDTAITDNRGKLLNVLNGFYQFCVHECRADPDSGGLVTKDMEPLFNQLCDVLAGLTAAERASPKRELVDDLDVEIAIAEAIQLIPAKTAYEDKGESVLQYLKKLGYQIIKAGGQKP